MSKTLEQLKKEMDAADATLGKAANAHANAADNEEAAWDVYYAANAANDARAAYHKKLKDIENDDDGAR